MGITTQAFEMGLVPNPNKNWVRDMEVRKQALYLSELSLQMYSCASMFLFSIPVKNAASMERLSIQLPGPHFRSTPMS